MTAAVGDEVLVDATDRCPLQLTCATCRAGGELAVHTARTAVGVFCVTLCRACARAGAWPRFGGWTTPMKLTLAHRRHAGYDPAELVDEGQDVDDVPPPRRRRPRALAPMPRTAIVDDFPGQQYATEHVGHLLEHLDYMRRLGRSDRTIWARRYVLIRCAEFLRADPADATFEDLEAWQRSRTTLDTMRWETSLIRPFYRYIQARGYRQDNPAALLPTPRARRRLPRPIEEDRLMAAVAEAPSRVLPWLLLAGWSALRAAEIAGLSVEDFWRDATGQVWLTVTGKGERQRDVPVPEWSWERIAPLLPASGPCWPRGHGQGATTAKHVSEFSNRYLRQKGFPDTFHALRHRAASEALHGSGGDVRMVQELLGHSNLATMHVYTRVRPASVAAAVAGLSRPPAVELEPPR